MNLECALNDYLAFVTLNRSDVTLVMYTRILTELVNTLGGDTDLAAVTSDDLTRALNAMHRPDHSPATQEKTKRTVKTFFNWLVKRRKLADSPVDFTVRTIISGPLDTSKAISEKDIEKILAACTKTRDRALVILLRDTAFRLSGVCNLRVDGIDWEAGTLSTFDAKMGEHAVFMASSTRQALRAWLDERSVLVAGLVDHGYVFTRDDGGRLSYWGVLNALRRLGKRAGVKCNAHGFRHAWGTWAVRNDVPVVIAQAQMGHRSAATTWNHYYKATPAQLRSVVDRRAELEVGEGGEGRN